MIIKEIEEFKLVKPKIKAYLSYIFSQNLPNFSQDITQDDILKGFKNISDEPIGYNDFYILDKNGYQISDNLGYLTNSKQFSLKGEDKSAKSYYKKVIKEKRAYLSNPYPNAFDSKLCVTMAVPIYSDEKELLYIACCDILLEEILKLISPSSVDSAFGKIARFSYFLISFTLFILSGILFYFGVKSIVVTNFSLNDTSKIFESTILLTLSLAILDLVKAYFEEEVLGRHEKSSTNSKTMIKFLSSIIIALAIESLMLVFKFAMTSPDEIIYPIFLIVAIAFLVAALGGYIYITKKAIFDK